MQITSPSSSAIHLVQHDWDQALSISSAVSDVSKKIGIPDPGDPINRIVEVRNDGSDLTTLAAVGGVRAYIPKGLGQGYWELIEVCPGLLLSISDWLFKKPHLFHLPPEKVIKVRVVCSGSIELVAERLSLVEGEAQMQLIGTIRPVKVMAPAGEPVRMIALHVLPDALDRLGINLEIMPTKLASMIAQTDSADLLLPIISASKLVSIAKEILGSRDRFLGDMRLTYVKSKALEMICEAFERIEPALKLDTGKNRLRKGDILRLHEARRILSSHLADSPTIDQISRMVGINRAKLMSGFRELFGETIHQHRHRLRMAEALRLIESSQLSISEIGQRTGFNYPSNFSQVIKQQFGKSPREIRLRGL